MNHPPQGSFSYQQPGTSSYIQGAPPPTAHPLGRDEPHVRQPDGGAQQPGTSAFINAQPTAPPFPDRERHNPTPDNPRTLSPGHASRRESPDRARERDETIAYLLDQVAALRAEKGNNPERNWVDSRRNDVSLHGDRATVKGEVYEFSVCKDDPDWISLDRKIDPSHRLTMSSQKVLEVTEEIFDQKPVISKSRGLEKIFSASTEDWVPFHRIFEALQKTYLPLFSTFTSGCDVKNAEKEVHKELLGKNQIFLVKPSDTLGLMSPETYSEWARDEVINITSSERVLKLDFPLAVPSQLLENERSARREVVRLHTSFMLLSAAGHTRPEIGEAMSAISHTLLPCLYSMTKDWLYSKFKCRWAALQLQKKHPTICLLHSNPWNSLLFDMESAGTEETDWIKTHGWGKVLSINEKTAKVIKSNANNIDWQKGKVNPTKSSRFFQRPSAHRGGGSSSYSQGTPSSASGNRFRPYSSRGRDRFFHNSGSRTQGRIQAPHKSNSPGSQQTNKAPKTESKKNFFKKK